MPHPPRQQLRVVAAGAPGDWAAESDATLLKAHDKGSVWRTTLGGRECVLKCYPIASPRRRAQSLLRLSPAWRHWRNARWLRAQGLTTGEPLAVLHAREQAERFECLILQYLPGQSVLDWLASGDLNGRQQIAIAEAVGRLAAGLARRGRVNRDAKPSNLIVTGVDETEATLAIIDCADLRPCRPNDRGAVARMLASAIVEPQGCGLTVGRRLRARCVRAAAAALAPADTRAVARALWRHVAEIVSAHGDPTPRDNPLGASSR